MVEGGGGGGEEGEGGRKLLNCVVALYRKLGVLLGLWNFITAEPFHITTPP